MKSTAPPYHPKYRTKLCRNFASGDCPFGQKCSFLHPAPSIDPSSSALAPNLLTLNPLLFPQLLFLSNQQEILKRMLRRSPPRPQGMQLVDEDPSPTTSLLLSKSDSISSEQVPRPKQVNRRRKYPCRHFIRTGGWCPAAGQCQFQHDVAALPSGVRKAELGPPFATDEHRGGRTISGGVLMGIQSPSPPIAKPTHSEPSRYIKPGLMQSYQPTCWANYTWQPYRLHCAAVPIPATPPSVAPHSLYPQLLPQTQSAPPNESQTSLPLGSYEMNGTTYFPTSRPSVSTPPLMPYSVPVHPIPYNVSMAPAYPYHPPAPPNRPAGYCDVVEPTTNSVPQTPTPFDPFVSDRMIPGELPVIPRLECYEISPIRQDVFSLPSSDAPPLTANGELEATNTTGRSGTPTAKPQEEFPYQPPKDQRVGHARRISVNVKKHGRVNSG